MKVYEAEYFDGQRARSHAVDLSLYREEALISFSHEGEQLLWDMKKCRFQQIQGRIFLRNIETGAQLVVADLDFQYELRKIPGPNKWNAHYYRLLNGHLSVYVLLFLLLMGGILAFNFYVLPDLTEKGVGLVPDSFDAKIGANSYLLMVHDEVLMEEETRLMQEFADSLNIASQFPLQLAVLNSSMVNAFALPDGHIVIYRGILEKMETYHELAALIGHEATHVTQRHGMRMMARNLASYMLISLMTSDINGIMGVMMENSNQLQSLSYSRDMEREADLGSVEILKYQGIRTDGMYQLLSRIQDEEPEWMTEMLSSHPLTAERMDFVKSFEDEEALEQPNEHLQGLFEQIKAGM